MKKPIKENILKVYGREPKTLNELAQCVIEVIESQENRDPWHNPLKHKPREFKNHKVVGFAWQIHRSEEVSNTHDAPEGYPQNWARRDESLPKGYPGWTGRVWIRYHDDPYSFSSSGAFDKTLTHPGTGGGGAYDGPSSAISSARFRRYGHSNPKGAYPEIHCFSWDYRLYDLDWPEVAKAYEQTKILHHLGGPAPVKDHYFGWIDPETELKDSQFLAEYAIWAAKNQKKAA